MSLTTLHRPCHLPLWHPRQQKLPEPAQGALLHPFLEVEPSEKSPEPAQGGLLHPTPLYKGGGSNERLPQPSQGGGSQPLIQPSQIHTSPPKLDSGCCCSRRDPSPDYCHADCHTPAPSEVPQAALTSSERVEAFRDRLPKIPRPPGASVETIRRLTTTWLNAVAHGKRAVKMQQLAQGLFTPSERLHRETAAMMQFLWNSGEPVLMEEVKLWLAADPNRKLDLSPPASL